MLWGNFPHRGPAQDTAGIAGDNLHKKLPAPWQAQTPHFANNMQPALDFCTTTSVLNSNWLPLLHLWLGFAHPNSCGVASSGNTTHLSALVGLEFMP
jgi:hypothetical protein